MSMIDLNKEYVTRDGRAVELFCDDMGGDYPILGRVAKEDGGWSHQTWTKDGLSYIHGLVLVLKPEVNVEYLNVYTGMKPAKHDSRLEAKNGRTNSKGRTVAAYVCTLKVTRVDGKVHDVEVVNAE